MESRLEGFVVVEERASWTEDTVVELSVELLGFADG